MLKYGRDDKMTFCAFIGHQRYKFFLTIFIFIVGVPVSSFVVLCFLLTSLGKDYFLRRRLQRYQFSMVEIEVLLVLNIPLPASSRILKRNRLDKIYAALFWRQFN